MLLKPRVNDGGMPRLVQKGDILAMQEQIATLTTAGDGTLTAAILANTIIKRTGPGAGYTDTTDTAAAIVAALSGNSANGVESGSNYRIRYINGVAQAMTLAAGTNVTLAGTTTCAASASKDYLVEITNGTPEQVFGGCSTTNASKVVTGLTGAQTQLLSVGMAVSGTNIAGGTKIASIQQGTGVTLDTNATGTGANLALTFDPTVTITGL